jgi:hypothetical protein
MHDTEVWQWEVGPVTIRHCQHDLHRIHALISQSFQVLQQHLPRQVLK